MDRWKVYEILKNKEKINLDTIKEIENMNAAEVKEGLIEWLLADRRHNMKLPCTPDCKRRSIYCHCYCRDYRNWEKQHKTRDEEESEYLGYLNDAIGRMKGERA